MTQNKIFDACCAYAVRIKESSSLLEAALADGNLDLTAKICRDLDLCAGSLEELVHTLAAESGVAAESIYNGIAAAID